MAYEVWIFKIFTFLCLLLMLHQCCGSQNDSGFKKKTFRRPPRGVTLIGKFSNPSVFFGHFVNTSKPLWMRSVLQDVNHPGLTVWTDDYLRKKFPNEPVKIENGKKEDRSKTPTWLTVQQFLSQYRSEDIYMVHSLNGKMAELVMVPQTLHCGGFQNVMQDAVLWLGSGETKSVLHYDELDNFICLLDGQKHVILIDKAHKDDVEASGFVELGGYSLADVDNIDAKQYPRLHDVEWYEVTLNQGDCLFIPRGWYHQVVSRGDRHMAVNIWLAHLHWFDESNCSFTQDFYDALEPVSTFGFASPNEVYRTKLLDKLMNKGFIVREVVLSSLDSTEARKSKFFDALNKYKDGVLSWSELYGFNIDKAIVKFPDVFGELGYVSDDEEEVILYEPFVFEPEDGGADTAIAGGNLMPDQSPEVEAQTLSPMPDESIFGSNPTSDDSEATKTSAENEESVGEDITTPAANRFEEKIEL